MNINRRLRAAVAAVALEAELGYPPQPHSRPSAESLYHRGHTQVAALARRLDMGVDELVCFARQAVDQATRLSVDRHQLELDDVAIQVAVELATGHFLSGLQVGERLRWRPSSLAGAAA